MKKEYKEFTSGTRYYSSSWDRTGANETHNNIRTRSYLSSTRISDDEPLPNPRPLVLPIKNYTKFGVILAGSGLMHIANTELYDPRKDPITGKPKGVIAKFVATTSDPWYGQAVSSGLLRETFDDMPDVRSSDSLLKQCWNNAANRGFDLGTQIGEAPEFVKYSSSLITKLYRSYHFLMQSLVSKHGRKQAKEMWRSLIRNTKRTRGGNAMDALTGVWLEHRYAVTPVLMALNDLADQAKKDMSRVGKIGSYLDRVRASDSNSVTSFKKLDIGLCGETAGWGTDFSPATLTVSTTRSSERRCGLGILRTWSEFQNFHVDPIKTAWELVPYSFVIDWFIDFGERLNYVSSRFMVDPAYAYEVYVERVVHTVTLSGTTSCKIPPPTTQTPYYRGTGSVHSTGTITHTRLVRAPRNPPGLSIIPEMNVKMNLKRYADSFSLLWQLRGRR